VIFNGFALLKNDFSLGFHNLISLLSLSRIGYTYFAAQLIRFWRFLLICCLHAPSRLVTEMSKHIFVNTSKLTPLNPFKCYVNSDNKLRYQKFSNSWTNSFMHSLMINCL